MAKKPHLKLKKIHCLINLFSQSLNHKLATSVTKVCPGREPGTCVTNVK